MPGLHGALRVSGAPEARGEALLRLRHSPQGVSREAARDSQLARLSAARLYVITPDVSAERVISIATAAVRGGAEIIQLRQKSMARGDLLDLARTLRKLLRVLFIVNDHVDVALLSDADGVHLGADDLSVAAARRIAGDRLLIGASASTPDAVPVEADYVGCGPAFATPVKREKRIIGPAGIAALASAVHIPVFAIGGIDRTNVAQLIDVGVRRACVIRAVGDAPDPEQAARELHAMLSAAGR